MSLGSTFSRLYWPRVPLGYTALALAWSALWLTANGAPLGTAMLLDFALPEVLFWNAWGLLTPVVVWGARRWPLPARWRVHLLVAPVVIAAVYAASLSANAGYVVLVAALGGDLTGTLDQRMAWRVTNIFTVGLPLSGIVYALVAAVTSVWDHVRRLRAEERRSAGLEADLARAELQALRMQLHPHLLFNALNTISATLQTDVPAADRMVTQLGDFLRLTLDHAHRATVPVDEEFDFCRQYLRIEQHRMEDRLSVEVHVAPAARGAEVPYLILQPLVENAMRHGVGQSVAAGRVALRAARDGADLVLDVENTGPPIRTDDVGGDGQAGRRGIGLRNTRDRLAQAYGAAASLHLADVEGGVRARIRLPFAPAAEPLDAPVHV